MASLLLAVIYMSFISLGLPDSLLGSAWPVMHGQIGTSVSYMGGITVIIALGTVVSSLMSDRTTKKFGAGAVTAVSTLLTALALLGFSVSDNYFMLCLFAVPYGIGAGGVDAALNNFVAVSYSSRHMSWLHCMWGVGASVSPYIMGYCLSSKLGWESGYLSVSVIQLVLSLFIFLSLPIWKKGNFEEEEERVVKPLGEVLKINGVKYVLLAFFGYCALEATAGLWASSFLTLSREIPAETAANFASLFYMGITAGRFFNGFVTDKFGDKKMIRAGLLVMLAGVIMIFLPGKAALFGLVITGIGCAPVYPCIIHSTPDNFGKENSQAIIGVQMASAYLGTTFMPPLMGLVAKYINISLYPVYLLFFVFLMAFMTEKLNKKRK